MYDFKLSFKSNLTIKSNVSLEVSLSSGPKDSKGPEICPLHWQFVRQLKTSLVHRVLLDQLGRHHPPAHLDGDVQGPVVTTLGSRVY
jgi:hypothetical protein